jgi:HK97 family phage portal protein
MGFLDRLRSAFSKDRDFFDEYPGVVVIKGWEELNSRTLSTVSNANPGTLNPTVNAQQALLKYRTWVYPCVNLIKNKVASVPFYLYKEVGQPNDEEFDRILHHPLLELLRRPNKYFDGEQFFAATQMYLDLCGCAFWLIIRDAIGAPRELYLMNPNELVTIMMGNSTDRLIDKFVFASPYQKQLRREYPYEDVVYFHYPNPMNPVLPFTPIQALAHVTDLDLYLQVYEKDFFQNNARPDFVIVPAHPIPKAQAERLSEGWNAKHRGPGRQFKPAVLTGEAKIEQVGMSAKDFEFMALSEWTKDNILAAYGVPEVMLGLMGASSKASDIAAEKTFVDHSVLPRLKVLAGSINLQLRSQFKSTKSLIFTYESAHPKDDEWELAKNQGELTMGLTTINEIRLRRGQKPFDSPLCYVPWMNGQPIRGINSEADKVWDESIAAAAGASMAAQGGMMGGGAPALQGQFGMTGGRPEGDLMGLLKESMRGNSPNLSTLINAARGNRGGLTAFMRANPTIQTATQNLGKLSSQDGLMKLITRGIDEYIEEILPEDERVVYKCYEEMLPAIEAIENIYKPVAEKFLVGKGLQISEIVKKNANGIVTKEPDEVFDLNEFEYEYKESSRLFIMKAVDIGFNFGLRLVEKGLGGMLGISPDEATYNAAGRFLDQSATLRSRTIKKTITKIIKTGLKEGMDVEDVADLIREKFADMGSARASMIARTELSGALDVGSDASFEKVNKDAGRIVVEKAVLWTALDERVCNDSNPEKNCRANHGTILKDYRTGKVYKESATLHPNCRCVRRPVLAEKS